MKQYRTLLLIVTFLFIGWTFLIVESCAQVKLTQVESDTVLYRIPVAHRTIPGQSGKYFMKYMRLEQLMDSLGIGGSGTVTSIATASPVTGGTITTTGTIGVDTTSSTGLATQYDLTQTGHNISVTSTYVGNLPAIRVTDAGGAKQAVVQVFSPTTAFYGSVPGANGDTGKFLRGDATWQTPTLSEVDGSVTNEGILGVSAGSGTTAVITSNTSGATGVTISAGSNITISESTSTNGGTITIAGSFSEVDGSITNEGYQGVTAGSGTSSIIQGYNSAGTATGTGTTINAAGSISISETTSTNGGQITLTGDYGAFAFGVVGSTTVIPLNGGGVAQIQPGTGITATNSSGTVTISNNAPYTYMNQTSGTTALTTTDAKIALSGDAASNGDALTTNYDNTNDEIDIAVTGTYQIGFSCNCKSNTAARAVIFSMKNNVTSTLVGFVKSYYFTNTDEYCETNFEYPVALTSGARLSLYAKTGGSTTSITDCNISMYARRVK